ncbi:MAG: SGNH/GDSL hydrolase family protein [Chloroflexales bacterium]|nr:SGNH/GDSL hydrolase family protein [Chloroflexales bacterium]
MRRPTIVNSTRLAGMLAVGLAGLVLWLLRGALRLRERLRAPEHNPDVFLAQGRPPPGQTVVVCAGDSLTHGVASADYLALLRQRFAGAGYTFVNAGINGNLAYNVAQRLDAIIACRPDVVTLLIGTNDVNATVSQAWEQSYREEQYLPEQPTLTWYCQNLEQIIDRLQQETAAQIAVLSLPMLGEHLESAINGRVRAYNAALQAITTQRRVTYLPLHETLVASLPPHHAPPPYTGSKALVFWTVIKHYLLGQSWEALSAAQGFHFPTKHIHLNERGAPVIAGLIGELLISLRASSPPPHR